MASYQQRIPLKGTEESIDFFTNVLKATKVCKISYRMLTITEKRIQTPSKQTPMKLANFGMHSEEFEVELQP